MRTPALPPRILIVDDEEANVTALCDTLRDHGYEAVGFINGDAALEALRQGSFELLVTDLMMPTMSGIELLRAAQKIDKDIVGIIMTGEGTIATAVEAMRTGAQDYILKPFKLSIFLPVLSRALMVRDLRVANAELELNVRQRTAELLAAHKKEERTQATLNEKNLLLAEIHHRVKNNLQVIDSLLDLEAVRIEDPVILRVLKNSSSRVKSMAMVHQVLYESQDFERVEFKVLLDELVPMIVDSFAAFPERITATVDATDVSLPIDTAIPCALVITELLSNALKHAFPDGADGEIHIELLHEMNDKIRLTVSDNGVGLSDKIDLQGSSTLGLQLVNILVEQLHGDIFLERANPTRFDLRFPGNRGKKSTRC
jgi:two-component sensor histidine kinase/ActR/RegA family two-component response regulator